MSLNPPIRILMAKPGLDGHDRGIKVLAAAYRDAGMDVIYLGLRQTPESIVRVAIQEGADVIALSILSGAHMTIFTKVMNLIKDSKLENVLVTGGGIIPKEDSDALAKIGVGELFGPGTPVQMSLDYIEKWVKENRRWFQISTLLILKAKKHLIIISVIEHDTNYYAAYLLLFEILNKSQSSLLKEVVTKLKRLNPEIVLDYQPVSKPKKNRKNTALVTMSYIKLMILQGKTIQAKRSLNTIINHGKTKKQVLEAQNMLKNFNQKKD